MADDSSSALIRRASESCLFIIERESKPLLVRGNEVYPAILCGLPNHLILGEYFSAKEKQPVEVVTIGGLVNAPGSSDAYLLNRATGASLKMNPAIKTHQLLIPSPLAKDYNALELRLEISKKERENWRQRFSSNAVPLYYHCQEQANFGWGFLDQNHFYLHTLLRVGALPPSCLTEIVAVDGFSLSKVANLDLVVPSYIP